MNDYQFKIVKIAGDFIWRLHPETDETTSAEMTVKMMMIEPCGILNTGHEGGERTAENDIWI